MGYVISLGSGLLVGICFLIWALRERSLRHKAEKNYSDSKNACANLRRDLVNTSVALDKSRQESTRIDAQVKVLQDTIDKLREKLRACRDPETVRVWLDDELSKQV